MKYEIVKDPIHLGFQNGGLVGVDSSPTAKLPNAGGNIVPCPHKPECWCYCEGNQCWELWCPPSKSGA